MADWKSRNTETWDEIFAAIDAVVADMPPVEKACSSCRHAEIPPMPSNPKDGWIGYCNAPIPANTLLHPTRVQLSFAAADAARWGSKRQKPCPAWMPLPEAPSHD